MNTVNRVHTVAVMIAVNRVRHSSIKFLHCTLQSSGSRLTGSVSSLCCTYLLVIVGAQDQRKVDEAYDTGSDTLGMMLYYLHVEYHMARARIESNTTWALSLTWHHHRYQNQWRRTRWMTSWRWGSYPFEDLCLKYSYRSGMYHLIEEHQYSTSAPPSKRRNDY